MNNNRPLGPKDEKSLPDYDTSFIGLNERLSPMQLQPGEVWRASNMRFRDGKARSRLGVQICPWMKGDGRTPWSEVYGGAVFSDPNEKAEWFLIAADGGVWKTRPSMAATPVPMPGGVTLTAASFTMFVQCFNVIIMLRGPDNAPLVCTDINIGFQPVVLTDADKLAGLSPMPNASYGLEYLNRLMLIQGKDLLAVSDVLNYTGYIAVTNTFRITEGNVDALIAVYPFGTQQLLCLKDQSVIALTNIQGDLTAVQQTEVTREYGCGAALGVAVAGTNAYWMSSEGRIRSLTLTQLNQTQTTDQALSDPLNGITMGRINGNYLSGVVAEVWDSKLYMAVPLDDGEVIGDNLVAPGPIYNGPYTLAGLVPGQTYDYVPGKVDSSLTNGAQVLTQPVRFTAQAKSVVLTEPSIAATNIIPSTVMHIIKGTNNGVLVYDFLNNAWCGADEGAGVFAVKQFLKATLNGKKRLFILGADGIIRLYEEGFEDEVFQLIPQGYIDIVVDSLPNPGDTIKIDNEFEGSLITAANASANSGFNWGCDTLANAQANLALGYSGTQSPNWQTGITLSTPIDGGVRMLYTLHAPPFFPPPIPPIVTITGTWAFVDRHEGVEVTSVGIRCSMTTRGYMTRSYVFANADRKDFLALTAMIATWAPDYTLGSLVSGVNSDTDYADSQTRDNTAYDVQGQAPWDPTNVNDDHGTPKRLDYAVALQDLGFNLGANGVVMDLLQTATERVPVQEKGHFVQLTMSNTQGQIELWAVLVEAQESEKLSGAVIG